MTNKITGETLIGWGYTPGKWFGEALQTLNDPANGDWSERDQRDFLDQAEPAPVVLDPLLQHRTNSIPFGFFLEVEAEENSQAEEDQRNNLLGVIEHMDALMRTPTIVAGAVMPDACPSGSQLGTIPVGGVVAAKEAIHPGFHSADVCCSMAITVFKRDVDVSKVLDIAQQVTHFGSRGRGNPIEATGSKEFTDLMERFGQNSFLAGLEDTALHSLGTQGDGNHFFYVGELLSTGEMAIVTHHGSRNVGGQLYKRGMAAAQRHTAIVSPRTPAHNAWIDSESQQGEDYWEALQLVRDWTKLNHFSIHDMMQKELGNKVVGRFWNEHNFVFRRDDGLFYHAKGATPSYAGFSADDTGQTLIPMNMRQPILIAEHLNNPKALGFAPHGAGRNLSRTAHMQRLAQEFKADNRGLSPRDQQVIFDRETAGIDARFYSGRMDLSELPSAYKNAGQVVRAIATNRLAMITDTIMPRGAMMAGNTSVDWRAKKAAKKAKAAANG